MSAKIYRKMGQKQWRNWFPPGSKKRDDRKDKREVKRLGHKSGRKATKRELNKEVEDSSND
jgi:hypothetical protein